MLIKTSQRVFYLLMVLSAATLCALPEEPKARPQPAGVPGPEAWVEETDRTLGQLLLKRPDAIKVIEYRDDSRVFILMKLSANSFGFIGNGNIGKIYRVETEDGSRILIKQQTSVITGKIVHQIFPPGFPDGVPATWVWAVSEDEFESKPQKKMVFVQEFSDKTVTIVVDWKAGKADAIKVVPLKKQ